MHPDRLPKSLRPYAGRIADYEDDRWGDYPNGHWVHLTDEWECDESAAPHTIHEDTLRACVRCLRAARRVRA